MLPSLLEGNQHIVIRTDMDNCEIGSDFLSYSADWCQSLDYCVPDRIPPQRLGPVSGIAEMTRSQQIPHPFLLSHFRNEVLTEIAAPIDFLRNCGIHDVGLRNEFWNDQLMCTLVASGVKPHEFVTLD
ncbi:hypothetical protein ACTXT7_009738 [Hymenolepis weldensis]